MHGHHPEAFALAQEHHQAGRLQEAELFRQPKAGDWESVFVRLEEELQKQL